MGTEILVAVLAFAGTVLGSLFGVIAASKVTNFRLQALEKKVDKHNQVVERMYKLEAQMKTANHRISDLERHTQEHTKTI